MNPDGDKLYRALRSRDPRYDGRVFVGVSTTGIFCRNVCPARTPKPEHCTFFRSAKAAASAGFRPCLRCRPASAPGSPAWIGTRSTVARAMRLIASGALDDERLSDLCERLGVGERHLRRLFALHVGATPAALAQARRVIVATRTIAEDASRPIADVAFASGFRSLRAFNAALAKACGKAPRELRRAGSAIVRDTREMAIVRAWIDRRTKREEGARGLVH